MFPGPVFVRELITTARRPRFHVLRTLFGLALLALLLANYRSIWGFDATGAEYSPQELARYGGQLFSLIATLQAVAVLAVTPALVAGTIVEEKQRKTIHYLLTSPLNSAEIVVGKLAARMLHVGVFTALTLPIVSLLTLFGGVDPMLIGLYYVLLATTAFFLASLSIFISTFARQSRQAFGSAYILGLSWLFLPPLVERVSTLPMTPFWTEVFVWVREANSWINASTPISLLFNLSGLIINGGSALVAPALTMIGLQLAYSAALILVAVVRLRPAFRAQESKVPRAPLWARRWRFFARPEVTDEPIFWKEAYCTTTSGLTKFVASLIVLGLTGFLFYALSDYLFAAARELWEQGYFNTGAYRDRQNFSLMIRGIVTAIGAMWGLSIASNAATTLTNERERDTWTSLTSTPLEGSDIIHGKIKGVIWSQRGFLFAIGGLWALGLALGCLHPLGLVAGVLTLAVDAWFIAALGVYLSLTSRNTGRAQGLTLLILMTLNGLLYCCIPAFFWIGRGLTVMLYLNMPLVFFYSQFSYSADEPIWDWSQARELGAPPPFGILAVFLYAVAGWVLTRTAVDRFDAIVGRPSYPTVLPESFKKPV